MSDLEDDRSDEEEEDIPYQDESSNESFNLDDPEIELNQS